jgi:hypothetical protein
MFFLMRDWLRDMIEPCVLAREMDVTRRARRETVFGDAERRQGRDEPENVDEHLRNQVSEKINASQRRRPTGFLMSPPWTDLE